MREDARVGRLLDAAVSGFEPLTARGFALRSVGDSGRGETVEAASDTTAIRVAADWLEGELDVTVQIVGGAEAPLLAVVRRPSGLHLQRLPRGVKRGVLEATLRQVADAMVEQAGDVLDGTPEGQARLAALTA